MVKASRVKDFGAKEYSEEFGECDIFEAGLKTR